MPTEAQSERPPVCDYEGSDYQESFWEQGGREYEDQVEAIAIKRLLPQQGKRLLEVGAGAGRNTPRYKNFETIVVMDFSTTQLERAQKALGNDGKYIYVAADVYRMPFVDGLFDAATMIRTLHHMAEAPKALAQVEATLEPKGFFLLEYANKQNIKAILRYWLGRQEWSPFDPQPVEFMELNFDFHPRSIRKWLTDLGFGINRTLTVSHFRISWVKRNIPTRLLVWLDSLFQYTGTLWQLSPSVFVAVEAKADKSRAAKGAFFKCPECENPLPHAKNDRLDCPDCGLGWGIENGIYNFKEALKN